MLSDNPACVGRFLRGEYKLKPHDYDSSRALKREANRILDKILAIIENITKHDDSLFIEGGKLKTGLNCLHNFNNEKRNYIKSGVEKDVLHLVEDLDRVMAKYKATYQIGTKSTTSEARKRKEQRKKGGKRKLATGERNKKKRMPYFRSLGGARTLAEDFAPDICGISQLETCLSQRQTRHACTTFAGANCFAREAQGIVLCFCT